MKSSTRRLLASGAAVAAVALVTTGCSTEDTGGGAGEMTGNLVIWDQQYENTNGWSDVMDAAAAAFEAEHEGVTIEHVGQTTDSAAYTQLLQAAFQAGSGPDVVMMQPANDGIYIYKDALAPLDAYLDASLVDQMVGLSDTSTDGHIYGLPDGVQAMVIYYNKALFEQAGLDPENPPTNFSELMDASAALKSAGITPFAGGNGATGDLSVWAYSTLNPGVGTAEEALKVGANEIKFTDPSVIDTLQQYVDIYEAGYFDDGVNSKDLGAGIADFSASKGAMSFNIATLLPYVADGNGDATAGGVGADNLGVMSTLGSPANYAPVGANVAWTVTGFSKHQQLAAEYIAYLSSVEVQQQMFDTFGWLPSNTGVDTTAGPSKTYPAMAGMLEGLLTAKVTQLPAHQWWKAPVATEYKKQMQAVFAGSISLEDAMAIVQGVQDQQ